MSSTLTNVKHYVDNKMNIFDIDNNDIADYFYNLYFDNTDIVL
jgi:hypothetical protein